MHLQYYFQSMMEDSQQDFDQNSARALARQTSGEVEYAQLDMSSMQLRQSGEEFRMADQSYEASMASGERVQYAAVVHSPYKHYHFFTNSSTGSMV